MFREVKGEEISLDNLSVLERACLCGYARDGENALFALERNRFPLLLRSGVAAYLAADFNGWEEARGEVRWKLEPREDGLLVLSLSWAEMAKNAPFAFKFINERGHWLDPPEESPNLETSMPGARNFVFSADDSSMELPRNFADLARIAGSHVPEGCFGVRIEDAQTHFRLFAPRASSVVLAVGPEPDFTSGDRHSLVSDGTGAWGVALPGDLSGHFYHYFVDGDNVASPGVAFDHNIPILDPYATAALGPAGPGIVRDARSLHLANRPQFRPPPREDLVIVEAHLRDLLAKASGDFAPSERLTFSGLAKWIRAEDCYLRKLGVNAIEFQPVLEPEAVTPDEYFWGYMPVNFFSPASHYSSESIRGSGSTEFREVVDACHDAGLAVILDVVYNHVGSPNHLARIDKALYFATDPFGRLTNHSGCGNDLRSDSPAARRLVVDSLKHLLLTFDLDGFRLDLAELLGLPLLKEIEDELREIKPDVHLIAEPWSFRGRLPSGILKTTYSLWDDDLREGLLAYVQGKGAASDLLRWLRGRSRDEKVRPVQLVRYLESHDDYAFIDRLTQNPRRNGSKPTSLDQRRHRLALAILLLSPGVPMLSAGQDLLRSKQGVRNTYLRGDLNALDYSLLQERADHHAYVCDLVSLRLSGLGKLLRLSGTPPETYYRTFESPDGKAAAILINADESEGSGKLFLSINPSAKSSSFMPATPEQFGRPVLILTNQSMDPAGLIDEFPRQGKAHRLPPLAIALWRLE